MFHIVGRDIYSETRVGTHCVTTLAIISIFITLLMATYFHQQYRGKALLRFHGNNGSAKVPQYYVIRALPTVFSSDLLLQISLLLSPSLENLQLQS
jgi:hypothetical protein